MSAVTVEVPLSGCITTHLYTRCDPITTPVTSSRRPSLARVINILRGLEGGRAAALRAEGHFFWADVRTGEHTGEELQAALGVPEDALGPLLRFDPSISRSRKFHLDADHVV